MHTLLGRWQDSEGQQYADEASESSPYDYSHPCWGAQLKGAELLRSRPCEPGFVRGRQHMKNKFCSFCSGSQAQLSLPADRVRGLPLQLYDAFVNMPGSGVWTLAAVQAGGGNFRVVNNTAACVSPRLIIFEYPPAIDLPWAPLPAEWIEVCRLPLCLPLSPSLSLSLCSSLRDSPLSLARPAPHASQPRPLPHSHLPHSHLPPWPGRSSQPDGEIKLFISKGTLVPTAAATSKQMSEGEFLRSENLRLQAENGAPLPARPAHA